MDNMTTDSNLNLNPANDISATAQMLPQAIAALGGAGSKLTSGYNNGQAALRDQLQQRMGINELEADKLLKMLIQTGRLRFVSKGETPPTPGQANQPLNAAADTADAGDSFAGSGREFGTHRDASGDVSQPPDPEHIGYNPLVNIGAEAAPGNVGAVPIVPMGANIGEATGEAAAVAGARAFNPGAVGGTMGYHNAGLMTAPAPIDNSSDDTAGDWYLVG